MRYMSLCDLIMVTRLIGIFVAITHDAICSKNIKKLYDIKMALKKGNATDNNDSYSND